MSEENTPDLSKPLSRWSAPYWAMEHGIAAYLDHAEWKVLCAMYHHLPNVRPGKGRLERFAGVSPSTVKRSRKSLKAKGLIDFDENFSGGNQDDTTAYTVADIRLDDVVNAFHARMTGATMNPVGGSSSHPQVFSAPTNGVHHEPGTGVTMNPPGVHHEPPTGVTMNPKVRNSSSQVSTQGKYKGAAVPPSASVSSSFEKSGGQASTVCLTASAAPEGLSDGQDNAHQKNAAPQEPSAATSNAHSEVAAPQVPVIEMKPAKTDVAVPQGHTTTSIADRSVVAAPPGHGGTQERVKQDQARIQAAKPGGEARAVLSARHMEAFLCYGEAGLDAIERCSAGTNLQVLNLPNNRFNWRRFLIFEPMTSNVKLDDAGRPVGLDRLTVPAFAGYFWFLATQYAASRGAAIRLPDEGKLCGLIKSQLENFGHKQLFDRIWTYGKSYDAMMSLVNRAHEMPNEASFSNSLIEQAYRKWTNLNEYEKQEVINQVRGV